jgi:conjugal transfer ATP-binding protein TraC
MDHYTESLLRSLKRNGTEYSDVLIKGPETLAVGRLVLDPYSATLYSSSPRVFSEIEEKVRRRPRAPRCDRAGRLSRFRAAEPGAPDFAEGELAEAAE